MRIVLSALIALALAGCVAPADFDGGDTIRAMTADAAVLTSPKTVYFATTRCNDKPGAGDPDTADELFSKRCWEAALKNDEMKRLGFGMTDGAGVTCGTAAVTVLPFGTEDKKAATKVDVPVSYNCTGDYATLRQVVMNTPCRCAIIFVHGYNTTFGFGIKRTAQLAYDLRYVGVPIMFSFGAGGRFSDYVNDVEAAELAVPALHDLLVALSRAEGSVAPKIDVIAHSMGSRMTLRAIDEGAGSPSLRYAVFAAPDIDPAAFLRLAGKAAKRTQRLTIYTAKYDVAMSGSVSTHGGYARVGGGLSAGVANKLDGVELIDATARATDPYAHSYFAETQIVLADIRGVLDGKPAAQRKPLDCRGTPPNAVACTLPCPEGASCGPSLYARFVHWLLD